MLRIDSLSTGYGKKQVLHEISIEVQPGSVATIIGANGSGKSTLLKATFGILRAWSGHVSWNGHDLTNGGALWSIRTGAAYVPQGQPAFHDLTVDENLIAATIATLGRGQAASRIEEVLRLFPALTSRRALAAGQLSAGEKQMLALARALVLHPSLLLLDEPSLGLAPSITRTVMTTIKEIAQARKATVVIVEHNVKEAFRIADTFYALRFGRLILSGPGGERDNYDDLRKVFL
jgi:branched-chain amino acid transport system ATP-binding protein